MNSYSGYGEDKWIYENINPPTGVFCEVGAYDGISSSNTLAFEQIGWTGMLVEPDPASAAKCIISRKGPVWCCAAGRAGFRPFFLNEADRGRSSFAQYDGKVIPVIVCPLIELLFHAGLTSLDLLSIDTEGTELEVWETLGTHRPKIVIMEFLTWGSPPRDKEIVERMVADGYREAHRTEANLIFVRR
jgi:FkbM family methyltransferase